MTGMTDEGAEFDAGHLTGPTRQFGDDTAARGSALDGGGGATVTPVENGDDSYRTPHASPMMEFCASCGGPRGPADRFCGRCGADLAPVPQPDPRPSEDPGDVAGEPATSSVSGLISCVPGIVDTPAAPAASPSPPTMPPITSAPGADPLASLEAPAVESAVSPGPVHEDPPPSLPMQHAAEVDAPPLPPIRPLPATPPPAQAGSVTHDVRADEDDERTQSLAAYRATRAMVAATGAPTVQAVHCPAGHANPAYVEQCRQCGTVVVDRSITTIPRPSLGILRFDGHGDEPLDQPLVIGRKPLADETTGTEPGRAVTLADPDKLLSRVHAEIRLADWQVQVIDRESMNHTFVQLPGQVLFQLRPGEPFPIPPGSRIVFAEVSECRYLLDAE